MTETARLVLAVDSTDIDRGERSLKKLDSAAAKTERETKNLTRATDQMSGAYRGLRTVLATVGAGLLVRELVQASDTYTELRSQIKLVTDSQEELNAVFAESYELANDTRGSLEGTVQLYTKLARSTEELGLANDELFTITKAVNQSFVVSGASAQEAEGAIRQLAQGMASGTLRGDELNSVMENSPRLAKAIAEGLGVTIGELRQLGADGKITAESITTALLSTAGSIDREFQDMERTVGQSLQQLQNDLLVTFGQTDTSEFSEAIDGVRSIVTDPGFQQGVVSLGTSIAELTGLLAGTAVDNAETLASVLEGLAVLAGGRATAAVATYAAAKGKSALASIADAKAEATATAAIARRPEAELIASRPIQQRALADAKATAGTNAHAFAMDNLTKATARATSAQVAHASASNAAAAASSRASVAARAASGAMGLLGGPVGVVTTAVLALGYFATSAGEAEEKAVDLDAEIDKLAGSFERLTSAQAQKKLMDLEQPFEDLQDEAIRLYNSIQSYQLLLERNPEDRSADNWKKRLIELRAELDTVQQKAEDYRATFSRLFEIAEGGGSGAGDKPEDKPSGGGSNSGNTDAIQKRIDALNLEAQTLGMTATQADLYKLAVDGATQSQIRAAEQAYATIDAYEAEREAIERNLESRRAAAEIVAEMEAERQKKIDGGEQLLEQYATEEELLNLHHQNRLEILEAARAADYDNKAKWDAAIMDEEENHEKNLTAMKRAEWESRVSITSGYLGMLSGLMSSENRKMFEIGKAAAIAQATVDTIAGSVRVFKDLPIWAAIPASAALLLTGFARVSAIQSTTFGGGGGGSLGGSPGISGGVQTVPAAPAPVQLDGAGGGNGNGINIYFQGDVNGLDEDSLTQALVGKLGEQINDLDYVLINKTSRQGRELSGD